MLRSLCFLVAATAAFADNDFQVDLSQSKYFLGTSKQSYMQAYTTCKRNGLTLAMERNAQETAELNELIKLSANLSTEIFFLGGLRLENSPFTPVEWVWDETLEPFDYTNWDPSSSRTYQCLQKDCNTGQECRWVTSDCSSNAYYICQVLDQVG